MVLFGLWFGVALALLLGFLCGYVLSVWGVFDFVFGRVLWCVGGLRRFLSADFGVMPMWLGIGVVLFPGFGRCGSPV